MEQTNVRIYKSIILPVVLYGCETWSLTVREEHKLRVKNGVDGTLRVLMMVLDGSRWSPSRPTHFVPGEMPPSGHLVRCFSDHIVLLSYLATSS
jgi:hypothetical protein